nr:immunoglobulin light chain junction region [Macaca mulatta]
FMQVLQTPHSF